MNETISYRGWPNCRRLYNDRLDLIATADVGPRIMHFGLQGGPNLLGAIEADQGQTGGAEFRFFGGHRLLYSPEVPERIYSPENSPVEVESGEDSVTLTKPVEPLTGIRKSLAIRLLADRVELVHTLANTGLWPVELAPWALTIMAQAGVAVVPLPRVAPPTDLLPDRALILWPYTRLDDRRLRWGGKYATLRQDPRLPARVKFGFTASEGWLAYLRDGYLFVKTFEPQPGAPYPDFGSMIEVFADGNILELETLGPLRVLEPGAQVTHVERWSAFELADCDPGDDASIEAKIAPLARQVMAAND